MILRSRRSPDNFYYSLEVYYSLAASAKGVAQEGTIRSVFLNEFVNKTGLLEQGFVFRNRRRRRAFQ